jgi:hypothetical protein
MAVIEYGLGDLDKMISALDKFIDRFESGVEACAQRMAKEAERAIDEAYENTPMDGEKDFTVASVPAGVGEYEVVATGESVSFLEWGAGVYYNPNPVDRPSGVSGIGEYGFGQGKNEQWKMPDGEVTHGNPAAIGFVRAREAIETNIVTIVKESFG